ncbi:MAG: FAD/NAD(P)-binding oxidoreductase [Anaerolineae bacterium]|nr:FAD/NAD(P)-binding oxidoreductase [Anaerolineae bacterium]MDQ7033605.1 FAD/NAD(P)-binding oxidoreductase [Anaerolineae bacterium]
MKNIVILGAGTGGTMVANKLAHDLSPNEWKITIVDKDPRHFYQPGFLFIPFGIYTANDVIKPKKNFLPSTVNYVIGEIEIIEPAQTQVTLTDGSVLPYDYLVIATGTRLAPEEIEGMMGDGWYKNIFDFYTLEGATLLAKHLDKWQGGRLVVNVAEMPIKCPVAPLEFLFLADWYFTEKGMRDKVELIYATPLPGAFTKPVSTAVLQSTLDDKDIRVETEFDIMEVDNETQVIRSYDEREVAYDLLVTIPTNMGAKAIINSGLGNELGFVPTDPRTLQSKHHENIFVIGDAANVPTSKAGSVVHFELETVIENIKNHMAGLPLEPTFDGHANCFIESGHGKAYLIDFNYETQPLMGHYPIPRVGPFTLLEETRANHLGKLGFKWAYWNMMLKARPMLVSNQMSMAGKVPVSEN